MERMLGLELRKLSNLTSRYFEQYSNKQSIEAVSGANSWIIGYIGDRNLCGVDVYQRDLEACFGITRSTASKVVNLMEQKGLIRREGVPHDARLKKLVLTEKSIEIKRLMDEDRMRFETVLRQGFNEEELQTLLKFIDKMKQNLQELSKEETLG